MHAALKILALSLAVLAFPAAAASRPSDAEPNSAYELAVDAFLRPAVTELRVRVLSETEEAPAELEKVQVKIWPFGGGEAETRNVFEVAAPNGVATMELPRLRLTQRVQVRALVKDDSQNVLEAETTVQYAQLGAISTDDPDATTVGAQVLENGGNAFDAAAAILFVLNVTQPHLAGIGGGSNIVAYVANTGRTYAIDARERAPADTPAQLYNVPTTDPPNNVQGYSVGVPGTLRAVDYMLREWGTTSLAEALAPATAIARDGFNVRPWLSRDLVATFVPRATVPTPRGTYFPAASKALLLLPGGAPLPTGHQLVQPDLARTFELIAVRGPDVFYKGAIADAIVEAQKHKATPRGEGRMAKEDLASYEISVREASHLNYRGYDVYSAAPGGSTGGLILLEALGLLEDERFPIGDVASGYGFGTRNTLHAMIEAIRLSLADRDGVREIPSFLSDGPIPEAALLSEGYLRDRSRRMNPFPVRMGLAVPGTPSDWEEVAEDGHTTHFSVIDKYGNVVSFTSTLADSFGSGILVPGYGFFLNDSLTLFNANVPAGGGRPNDPAPGRRPMGSMTPVLITNDGEPYAATGTYGASFIPTVALNIVLDLIDHDLPLQTAVDAGRIWTTFPNGPIAWNYAARPGAPTFNQTCSTGTPLVCSGVMEELRAIGHPINRRSLGTEPTFGSLASVGVDPATFALQGAADPRQPEATAVVVPR